MKIAQITDLHLTCDCNASKNGVIPYESLLNVLSHIKINYPEIEEIVVTGDISNDETRESYDYLQDALEKNNFKYSRWIAGNHDNQLLVDEFNNVNSKKINEDALNLQNYTDWEILLLNTKIPKSVAGKVDDSDLQSILETTRSYENKQLNEKNQKKFVIFMHHPLIEVESKWIDKVSIENKNEVISKLSSSNSIKGVFCGHVHQEYFKEINGIKFYTTPSTCYQFKPEAESFKIDFSTTPGYRVIDFTTDNFSTYVVRI